jgi:hypothetical protein
MEVMCRIWKTLDVGDGTYCRAFDKKFSAPQYAGFNVGLGVAPDMVEGLATVAFDPLQYRMNLRMLHSLEAMGLA